MLSVFNYTANYTIPKIKRELKRSICAVYDFVYYTIPKNKRELKHSEKA